jgi:hypothetical protein
MAEPTIKARLVLDTKGGVSGGGNGGGTFSKSEERTFRKGEMDANAATALFLPRIAQSALGAVGGIGAATIGLNLLDRAINGDDPVGQFEEIKAEKESERIDELTEELENMDPAAKAAAEALIQAGDSSDVMRDKMEFAAEIVKEGGGSIGKSAELVVTAMDAIPQPVQDILDKFGELKSALGDMVNSFISKKNDLDSQVARGFSSASGGGYSPNALTSAVVASGKGNALTNAMVSNANTNSNGVNR